MKLLLGAGTAFLLLVCACAWADTTSDLAQCEKTVKFKTGDIGDDDVAHCMKTVGYELDDYRQMDMLTKCGEMSFPGIEMRCYRKEGVTDTGPVPPPVTTDWRTKKIDVLLAQEADWNDKCRGGMASLFLTADFCNRRDRLVMVLQARGWCWQTAPGKEDLEANKIWQACRKEADER